MLLAGFGLRDPLALCDDVAEAIGHPGIGGLAVAARAARLLVVGLDGFRQAQMRDEAHIRFVDAHAEGDRCNHDQPILGEKALLNGAAYFRR